MLALCSHNASERFTIKGYGGLGQDWKGYKTSIYKLMWNLENWDTSSAFTYMNMSLLQEKAALALSCHLLSKEHFINHSKPCIILHKIFSGVSQSKLMILKRTIILQLQIPYESPHRRFKPCQRPSYFQMCTDRDNSSENSA